MAELYGFTTHCLHIQLRRPQTLPKGSGAAQCVKLCTEKPLNSSAQNRESTFEKALRESENNSIFLPEYLQTIGPIKHSNNQMIHEVMKTRDFHPMHNAVHFSHPCESAPLWHKGPLQTRAAASKQARIL